MTMLISLGSHFPVSSVGVTPRGTVTSEMYALMLAITASTNSKACSVVASHVRMHGSKGKQL
jgi:hypothetical protein